MSFNDEEVDNKTTEEVTSCKDISVAEVDVFGDERREESEKEIPEPVAGGGQGHSLGSVARGEDFCHDGPDHGTPSCSETKNEKTGKDNHGNASLRCVCRVATVQRKVTDRCKNKETDEHPRTPRNKRLASSIVLNNVQTDKGNQKVNSVEDDLRLVAVNRHGAKDGSPVVEEVIGTSQLLEHLQRHTKEDTVRHARRLEHLNKLLNGVAFDLVLGAQLGIDFFHLSVDGPVIGGCAVDFAECVARAVDFALAVVETGCVGEEEDSDAQDESEDPADADDDAP